jgi:hypothetical protein
MKALEQAHDEYRKAWKRFDNYVLSNQEVMICDERKTARAETSLYDAMRVAGLTLALAKEGVGDYDGQMFYDNLSALKTVRGLSSEQEEVRTEAQRVYDAHCAIERAQWEAEQAAHEAAALAEYERERPAREKRRAEVKAALAALTA